MTGEQAAQGLGAEATTAVLWSALQRWVARLCGLATVAILARLLGPHDFGTVAVALAVLPVAYLLGDMGFSTYITQARVLDGRALSTAFWFSAAAGLLISATLVLAAPLATVAFGVTNAASVVRGVAPAVMCVMLGTVPIALLRRQLRFKALAVQSMTASLAGQVVAVALALAGGGVWALVAQAVVNQAVSTACAWRSAGWRPSLAFSGQEFATMASFGVKVVGVDLVAQLRAWVEYAVIASALGVAGLGYLNIAQRLIQVAQDVTSAAVLPVSTVVFARVRQSADLLRGAYVRALGLSYAAVGGAMAFLLVGAPVLVPLLFGDQWGPSVPAARILAVAGILTMGAMLDHGLFYGTGRPGRWFCYGVVIDGITVLNAVLLARHGLTAWCFGFLAVALLATVARWPLVARLASTSSRRIALVLLRAGVTTGVTAAVGLGVFTLAAALPDLVRLGVSGLAMAAVHVVAMRRVMRSELDELVRLGGPRWASLRRRWAALRHGVTAVDAPAAGPGPALAPTKEEARG